MNVYKQVMVIEMFQFFFLVGFHMLSMLWSKVLFEKTGKRVVFISQAYRAGVIWRASSQYFLNENYGRHLWFYGQRRAEEKKKFIPRGRSTVENEKRCGSEGVNGIGLYPLPPVSDQDRISPYYICAISCRQVMRIKKNINYGITDWSDTKFFKLTQWESFGKQWWELNMRSWE